MSVYITDKHLLSVARMHYLFLRFRIQHDFEINTILLHKRISKLSTFLEERICDVNVRQDGRKFNYWKLFLVGRSHKSSVLFTEKRSKLFKSNLTVLKTFTYNSNRKKSQEFLITVLSA